MKFKDWISVVATILVISSTLGAAGIWAADKHNDARYVRIETLTVRDVNDLDDQITFIKIKERNGEATRSELDYMTILEGKRDALVRELGQ